MKWIWNLISARRLCAELGSTFLDEAVPFDKRLPSYIWFHQTPHSRSSASKYSSSDEKQVIILTMTSASLQSSPKASAQLARVDRGRVNGVNAVTLQRG